MHNETSSSNEKPCIFDVVESLKTSLQTNRAKKFMRDVWSLNDTLSAMLDRHHENLNNFQVAGDALETGGKLYGMQVDSMASNAQRMSVLLNTRARVDKGRMDEGQVPRAARKIRAKQVSTIIINKAKLNAPLETIDRMEMGLTNLSRCTDQTSESSRMLVNILGTRESELLLNGNFKFWDSRELEKTDYTAHYNLTACEDMVPFPLVFSDFKQDELRLRPKLSYYTLVDDIRKGSSHAVHTAVTDPSMAFDMHSACQPVAQPDHRLSMMDTGAVQSDAEEERTTTRNFYNSCESPVTIEDLRPVDATSNLEYSYRPLHDLPRTWVPPPHWKLKRPSPQPFSSCTKAENKPSTSKRRKSTRFLQKKPTGRIDFMSYQDNLFFDKEKFKIKTQKIWNPCCLLLASDLPTESQFAPHMSSQNIPDIDPIMMLPDSDSDELEVNLDEHHSCMDQNNSDSSINVGIPKESRPWIKRIGIDNVKRAMGEIIHQQLQLPVVGEQAPKHPEKGEEYEDGVTSYTEIRKGMEHSLAPSMGGSVSAALALLSILHVACDKNLRLIPQKGRKDFQIRKIRKSHFFQAE